MTTVILLNGETCFDTTDAAIACLTDLLGHHPLNRGYELFSGFIEHDARDGSGRWRQGVENAVSFFGDFFDISHFFHLVTNDAAVVERLTGAIAANRQRPDYLRQPPPYLAAKLVITRRRFSTTQGEVLLIYDGQPIDQYGDDIRLNGQGAFEGHDDQYWHEVAQRVLERRHIEAFDRALTAGKRQPPT